MTEQQYKRIGETLYHGQLDNGLHIYVNKKPGFGKAFAFFATRYGGMDTRFFHKERWQDTPHGVAHFLEHKLFDTEDGNALQDMAAAGASPNAFTSSAITGYFFDCTERFYDNLKQLLSFVSVPYFTDESVAKEQGIIAQEIRMGDDSPHEQVFYQLMDGLYHHHPIRTRVAGTVESISQITPETLYACHSAFYNPANMVLTVAGDVEPDRVMEVARRVVTAQGGAEVPRDYGQAEPEAVVKPYLSRKMEVSTPLFQLGFKAEPAPQGPENLRFQLLGELACEALFGISTPLYARLYAQGLINKSFSYGYESYPGCALAVAGGESKDPQAVRRAILEEAARVGEQGIDSALWSRLKKAAYGEMVRGLNSFEGTCIELAQAHFDRVEYFRFPEIFDTVEREDVEDCIRRWFVQERAVLSVVEPKEEQNG